MFRYTIVKFYLENIQEAGGIFVRNALLYESNFQQPASEERIWRHACELKLLNAMSSSERKSSQKSDTTDKLIPSIAEFRSDDILAKETRQVIQIARDLFESSVESNFPKAILSNAHLLHFAQDSISAQNKPSKVPVNASKMRKLTAWYYLGLYNDVIGNVEESRKCMKMALRLCPSSGKSDDIVHTLPLLHMSIRDWFDDSEFDEDPLGKSSNYQEHTGFAPTTGDFASVDPIVATCIRTGVAKLKLVELRQALRILGLNTDGSKQELQERLFFSSMTDARSFGQGNIP